MEFLISLVNGLGIGGVYAMIALGYTMVYGIAKMLNFAHGDVIMVGGYTIVLFLAINPVVAVIAAIIFCVILGITIEKLAYKPLRGSSPLAVLITAIGVSYLLQSVALMLTEGKPKMLNLALGAITAGKFYVKWSTIITIICTVIVMVSLTLFVKKTKTGRAMVAVSEDKGAARLMGINVNFIIMITFAIGSALAALAAFCYLLSTPSVVPTMGAIPGIKAFTAAVIGGIGSIPGAMLGGILLGLVESFSLAIPQISAYTEAIEFSLLIIILLVKPTGILGKKRREKV
jgi:branched-chain amino acid transport system permease protein